MTPSPAWARTSGHGELGRALVLVWSPLRTLTAILSSHETQPPPPRIGCSCFAKSFTIQFASTELHVGGWEREGSGLLQCPQPAKEHRAKHQRVQHQPHHRHHHCPLQCFIR